MTVNEVALHGRQVSFRQTGTGQLVLLVHGLVGTMDTWNAVIPELSTVCTVLAPDLPGYGRSAAPAGDYSLGAYAGVLRDLLDALGHRSATIVGHSLGGGVAMQFSYQFPERCERIVLVSSGGLGSEVSSVLRAAALPGVELVLPVVANHRVTDLGRTMGQWLGSVGIRPNASLTEYARAYATLADPGVRRTFIHSLRAVVDHRGQRVDASDRLHLIDMFPTLFVWGTNDRIIPVDHARRSHSRMPRSQLEIIEHAGHFPHIDQPHRFVQALHTFIDTTEPATG